MKLKNKKVLVYGLGDSGRALIKVLQSHGARYSFYDDDLKYMEYVGFERQPEKQKYDFVIVSPGIKVLGNQLLEHFYKENVLVISELDFAYLLCKGKIVAITGTNGKTTVSMLTNKILSCAGYKTFLCGNIGLPFSAVCEKTTSESVVVLEVSNFQLETTSLLSANVACILNIRPDHLDRHGSFEEYRRVKGLIAQKMKKHDTLILNLDDAEAKKMILHKNYRYFSKFPLKKGVYIYKNQIFIGKKSVLSLNNIHLIGEKNLENVLASVSICSCFKKVTTQAIETAVSNFVPASHRIQIVGMLDGVTYVDDSKATNVASTVACVEAFKDKSIVLLMGGLGKEIDYDELFAQKFPIKKVVCFGADGENIFKHAQHSGYDAKLFSKFDEAVLFAKQTAVAGDYVLLSPSCASFDEFQSYAERGEHFKNLILGSGNES
ncbi:MAG: UDP-N-acetylmuramoyl-L-alanine--D-glutamate ligase [Candidatus Caccovivens sp.]